MNDFALLAQLGTSFCLDTETALAPLCFQPGQVRLIQFHSDTAECWFDASLFTQRDWALMAQFLAMPSHHVYGQNLAFDIRVLAANGVTVGGELYDTMIGSQLLHNGGAKISHSLENIVKRELGQLLDKSLQATGGASSWMEGDLTEERIAYAINDVRLTYNAAHVLHEKLNAQGLWDVYRLECALAPAVAQMEAAGMPLDPYVISETIDHYGSEAEAARCCFLETLDGRLQDAGAGSLPKDEDGTFNTRTKDSGSIRAGTKRLAGFNINSSQQVLAWFKLLGIEPVDEAKKASLDKKLLARFQSDELVRMYLHYKRVEKRLGMAQKLVEHCDDDGRIRARFMPLATGTGRFASSGPNLQQIPRDAEFRCAFKAPAGRKIVQADYSAMELRVAAAIAQEQQMLDAFNAGVDIHLRTAALMFGIAEGEVVKEQRQQAKAVNFGALYGGGAYGLQSFSATIGQFITFNKAFELLARWHDAYPAFGEWHKLCEQRAEKGEAVRTRIGRRRKLFGPDNRLTTQANSEVQGTSADIMKAALVEIYRGLPAGAFLIATVHDEVLVECSEAQAPGVLELVLREMEAAALPILGSAVRISAEGGILDSWGDK